VLVDLGLVEQRYTAALEVIATCLSAPRPAAARSAAVRWGIRGGWVVGAGRQVARKVVVLDVEHRAAVHRSRWRRADTRPDGGAVGNLVDIGRPTRLGGGLGYVRKPALARGQGEPSGAPLPGDPQWPQVGRDAAWCRVLGPGTRGCGSWLSCRARGRRLSKQLRSGQGDAPRVADRTRHPPHSRRRIAPSHLCRHPSG